MRLIVDDGLVIVVGLLIIIDTGLLEGVFVVVGISPNVAGDIYATDARDIGLALKLVALVVLFVFVAACVGLVMKLIVDIALFTKFAETVPWVVGLVEVVDVGIVVVLAPVCVVLKLIVARFHCLSFVCCGVGEVATDGGGGVVRWVVEVGLCSAFIVARCAVRFVEVALLAERLRAI